MTEQTAPEEQGAEDDESMRKAILEMPMQAEQGYKMAEPVDLAKLKGKYLNVVLAGMGGSGIAGMLLKDYLADQSLIIELVQDYSLPASADEHTLVIVCSYSGNTEEALSVFKDARRKGCGLVAVTTGGKLAEYAGPSRTPVIMLPRGYQPRAAMPFEFFAVLRLLERLRLVKSRAKEVLGLKNELQKQAGALEKNAEVLAQKLVQKTPVVYTSSRFASVGYRWKCQFNENSKILAFNNVFPEMNHNELEGFEHMRGDYHAIILRFDQDHRRVQKRMGLAKQIMLRKGMSDTEIGIRGPSYLSKMFSAVMLGDLTSYYLAQKLGVEPSEVRIIEGFKQELGPYVA